MFYYFIFKIYYCIFNIYSFLLAHSEKELDSKPDIEVIFKLFFPTSFFFIYYSQTYNFIVNCRCCLFLHKVSLWLIVDKWIVNLLLPQPLEMQSCFIPPVRVIVQIPRFHNGLTVALVFIFILISLLHKTPIQK